MTSTRPPARTSERAGSAVNPAPNASRETIARVRANLGQLSTVALKQMDQSLPWYRGLRPEERSALGLVAQQGISSFVSWLESPSAPQWVVNDVFGAAPTELTRSISLQMALQLIRAIVDVVERQVPHLAPNAEQPLLREAVLIYSREVAFATADVYARAAESRGAWDSRLEALVVDAIMRGEDPDSLRSRISAIGWKSQSDILVMIGNTPENPGASFVSEVRRAATRHVKDCLVGIQGDRLILLLGGVNDAAAYVRLAAYFGPGPVVHSTIAQSLQDATKSAQGALAALAAAHAWPEAPRPVSSTDLWPERLMNGDATARTALVEAVYQPLQKAGNGLIETLAAYLELGHSLEATSRELFIHTNTVRYRLKRVLDITSWDPLIPRDAFVLHCALTAGRLAVLKE
ncbi:PucR family transcriptional regulator [Neomicrococcus aestuarii]|uniref:PucR family transcriptional regulator n=1 Tax=Neomicrococcus aestuarii TaxID=556325 RepID=A0A1L2ZKS7_9MICC|nr:PucR family transcriptional regulator [Neomicrococcus aestuarii]